MAVPEASNLCTSSAMLLAYVGQRIKLFLCHGALKKCVAEPSPSGTVPGPTFKAKDASNKQEGWRLHSPNPRPKGLVPPKSLIIFTIDSILNWSVLETETTILIFGLGPGRLIRLDTMALPSSPPQPPSLLLGGG